MELADPEPKRMVVIDSLLGSGISKPLEGLLAAAVHHINSSGNTVVSIDVPAGLPADAGQWDADRYRSVVSASTTLTFRSEERRLGKECVSTCISRWSTYHKKKKK